MNLFRTFPYVAVVVSIGCATTTAASTSTTSATSAPPAEIVSAGVTLEAAGAGHMHGHAVLVDASGANVGTIDLGEVAEDPASCVATDPPSIAEEALSVTFACGLVRPTYQIALVDRRDHVAVWVFLGDEGSGNWERMGELIVPEGARARLLGEPMGRTP